MRLPWVWIAVIGVALAAAGGGTYLTRNRPQAQPPRPRDPGMALILSIRVLEQNPETRLTREQVGRALPILKALKDVPPEDESAAVMARSVTDSFTPAQRAALKEARQRFQERRPPQVGAEGGVPGLGLGAAGGGERPPGGPGAITEEQRAQFRTRAFERMIRFLERRMQ